MVAAISITLVQLTTVITSIKYSFIHEDIICLSRITLDTLVVAQSVNRRGQKKSKVGLAQTGVRVILQPQRVQVVLLQERAQVGLVPTKQAWTPLCKT